MQDETPAQEAHLGRLMLQALQALTAAGLTACDFLDALPAARAQVVREAYGDDSLREIEQLRSALLAPSELE